MVSEVNQASWKIRDESENVLNYYFPLFCEQDIWLMGQFSSQVQVWGSVISFEFNSEHVWNLQHFWDLLQVLRPQALPKIVLMKPVTLWYQKQGGCRMLRNI